MGSDRERTSLRGILPPLSDTSDRAIAAHLGDTLEGPWIVGFLLDH